MTLDIYYLIALCFMVAGILFLNSNREDYVEQRQNALVSEAELLGQVGVCTEFSESQCKSSKCRLAGSLLCARALARPRAATTRADAGGIGDRTRACHTGFLSVCKVNLMTHESPRGSRHHTNSESEIRCLFRSQSLSDNQSFSFHNDKEFILNELRPRRGRWSARARTC